MQFIHTYYVQMPMTLTPFILNDKISVSWIPESMQSTYDLSQYYWPCIKFRTNFIKAWEVNKPWIVPDKCHRCFKCLIYLINSLKCVMTICNDFYYSISQCIFIFILRSKHTFHPRKKESIEYEWNSFSVISQHWIKCCDSSWLPLI